MRFIPLDSLHLLEEKLREILAGGNQFQQRDALAVCLGLHGFRVREVSLCKAEGLDIPASRITPPRIKRSKVRSVPLHASVVESILKWRNGRSSCWLLFTGKNKRVFPSHFQRACRRITQEVYGYSYRFHALRHTFAMKVYARTHDLLLVKKLLGHNFVTSTQIYAEALDDTPTDLLFNLNISSSVGVEASSVGSTSVTQCNPKAIQELYKPPIGGLPVASMLAGRWSGVDN